MTDLEITRLCAEAMKMRLNWADDQDDHPGSYWDHDGSYRTYWPLYNDAQAMALVKKLQMLVRWDGGVHGWTAGCWYEGSKGQAIWTDWTAQDLNSAICECVAKMQAAK